MIHSNKYMICFRYHTKKRETKFIYSFLQLALALIESGPSVIFISAVFKKFSEPVFTPSSSDIDDV